jgi:hypothetical protein
MTPEEKLRKRQRRHVFKVLASRCDELVRKPWLGRDYNQQEASAGERALKHTLSLLLSSAFAHGPVVLTP